MDTWLHGRPENIYSHKKRLAWIAQHLPAEGNIVELGCGTGVMLTIPLCQADFDVIGLDRDAESIRVGREIASELGVDPSILRCAALDSLEQQPDAIIASEVLEHLPDRELDNLLGQFAEKLSKGGRLLVTVPNGYGWYELEAWLWKRLGLGRLINGSLIERGIRYIKIQFSGYAIDQLVEPFPSSLEGSPHVQRFTLASLVQRVSELGFEVHDRTGSGLFAGQLSNLMFTGLNPVTRFNNWIGDLMPRFASGFYVEFIRR